MKIAIESLTLEVADPTASEAFYETGLGVGSQMCARTATGPSAGFRGFTISPVVGQRSTVDSLLETALAAGARSVKPAKKGL